MMFSSAANPAAAQQSEAVRDGPAFDKLAVSQALDKVTRATDLEREGQADQAIPLIESAVGVF